MDGAVRKILQLTVCNEEVYYSLYGQFETLRDFWVMMHKKNLDRVVENEARIVEITEDELKQIPEERIVEHIIRKKA
jgi:tRNA threonylcarbamoyladenosine modification (KEOPS) complex Cgi121 subunit